MTMSRLLHYRVNVLYLLNEKSMVMEINEITNDFAII